MNDNHDEMGRFAAGASQKAKAASSKATTGPGHYKAMQAHEAAAEAQAKAGNKKQAMEHRTSAEYHYQMARSAAQDTLVNEHAKMLVEHANSGGKTPRGQIRR